MRNGNTGDLVNSISRRSVIIIIIIIIIMPKS